MPFPPSIRMTDICVECGKPVHIPPGVLFEEEPYHRHCYHDRKYELNSLEFHEPRFDELEHWLDEILDVDSDSGTWPPP